MSTFSLSQAAELLGTSVAQLQGILPSSGVKTCRDGGKGPALIHECDLWKLRAVVNGERLPGDPTPEEIAERSAVVRWNRRKTEMRLESLRERVRLRILKLLRIHGSMTIPMIEIAACLNPSECTTYIRELEASGRIQNNERWLAGGYSLSGELDCCESSDSILEKFRQLPNAISA